MGDVKKVIGWVCVCIVLVLIVALAALQFAMINVTMKDVTRIRRDLDLMKINLDYLVEAEKIALDGRLEKLREQGIIK